MSRKITNRFFMVLVVLCATTATFAQGDCNCDNDSDVKKFLGKAYTTRSDVSGNDMIACSPCAEIARALCLCRCLTTNHKPADIQQKIDYNWETVKGYRQQKVADCCPEYPSKPFADCSKAGSQKEGNNPQTKTATGSSAANGGGSQSPPPPPKTTIADYNNSFVGVANALGALGNDESGRKYLQTTNQIHNTAGAVKDFGSAIGASSDALNVIDGMETGAHVVNTFFGDIFSPPTEEELRREAEQAAKKEAEIRELQAEHNQAALVLKKWNNGLKSLHDAKIANYDSLTLRLRLVVLRGNEYAKKMNGKSNHFMTRKSLYDIVDLIEYEEYNEGTLYMLKIIDELVKKNAADYTMEEIARLKNNR